ncbi:uncharacterized protein E0L32_009132 [Thyridium curvatum]|uniref:Rhomboid-type serine protease n=1 Tax=Thyridium curvatum TaxID=1093900 RepID=A0A507AXE5_9PEZI|nr:uncharacterized protein E0L32_009132 [Thyridium curvatum]TPX09659.1 hypothetical protein E0L32_009132 [Thyridium curvatum]
MASHNYYGTPPPQHQNYGVPNPQQPAAQSASSPYYTPYDAASTVSSYPPSYAPYSSQQHLTSAPQRPPQSVSPVSPFETPFDDHVYPTNSRQPGGASAQSLPQDTGYHGLGRTPSEDQMMANQDGIPLQNRPTKDLEGNDHVYEVPRGTNRAHKGKVRFGELGMFGAGQKKITFVVYFFTLVQVAVFLAEVIRNAQLTGSPIMIKPQFNPMIGPSSYVMINMGARFTPCMHNIPDLQGGSGPVFWHCPNSTTDDTDDPRNKCTLSEVCGFGGVPNPVYNNKDQSPEPNQWFRFIIPIVMHAGIIHIGFNLVLQLTLGRDMEKAIGSIRFFLVYISAGIFGNVLGGNFAGDGLASTGASGALFGIIALTLLDLLYSWKDRRNPLKDLLFIGLEIVISFVLGLLPGLDNFAHIGGFFMGLALGISVLHSPNALRRRIGEDASYASVNAGYLSRETPSFMRNPIGFFKGRKPLWWAWWLVRAGFVVVVVVVFILLLNNFYFYHHTCSWCKYLSCINVNNWCDMDKLQFTPKGSKRALELLMSGTEQMSKRLS